MINLIKKYKDFIFYIIFGVLTTLINIASYYVFAHLLNITVVISSILSWVVAVLFAYITNKKWVFHSKAKTIKEILKEIISFFSCRLFTGMLDWIIMFVFVDCLSFNDMIIKIISNIIVIILNYIFSKLVIFNNKQNNKATNIIKEIGVLIFLLALSFLILLECQVNIFQNGLVDIDQSVFQTVALMMKNGFMPYKDSFDHKGPLIYLYNYIGLYIDYYKGIWYIELVNMFIALYYGYKIARLKVNRFLSIILVFISSLTIMKFLNNGNMTEEFALPFITISLYIFLDYILNNKVNKLRIIVCGFSLGGVLLLRPNMISVWAVFCIYILIKCIREKQYNELKKFIIFFLIGMALIITPFMVWLGINNTLRDFFNDYILFNFKYTQLSETGEGLSAKVKALCYYESHILALISLLVTAFLAIVERKKIYFLYIGFTILTLLLISMSGNLYDHYGLPLSLIAIFPLSSMFTNEKKYIKIISIIIITALTVSLIPKYYKKITSLKELYNNRNEIKIASFIQEAVQIIKENSDINDRITEYGHYNFFYILSERMHATKYSYTYPIANVNPKIRKEYFAALEKEMPKLIVLYSDYMDEYIKSYIEDNNYSLIFIAENSLKKYFLIYKKAE